MLNLFNFSQMCDLTAFNDGTNYSASSFLKLSCDLEKSNLSTNDDSVSVSEIKSQLMCTSFTYYLHEAHPNSC